MKGHNPSIHVDTALQTASNGKLINLSSYVRMKEGQADWTCFDQYPNAVESFVNLDVDYPGCYLQMSNTNPNVSVGSLDASGGADNHSWTTYSSGSGLIASAKCRSDTSGDDWGKVGCSPIDFNSVLATLNHDENRFGKLDLTKLIRITWFSRLTSNRRVAQLAGQQVMRLNKSLAPIEAATKKTWSLAPPSKIAPRSVVPRLRLVAPKQPAIKPP